MSRRQFSLTLFLTLAMTTLAGCSPSPENPINTDVPVPDYAQETSWLAFPDEQDEYPVDVFWVYPTVGSTSMTLMDITDPTAQQEAQDTVDNQASVFAESANIYAPYYRQLSKDGFSLDLDLVNQNLAIGEGDIWDAFNYYLENYNNGKPFIIAAHSQGSSDLMDLLPENWGTTGAEDRMIAAYIIGWSVTPDDIAQNPKIRMCQSATDTGCFISYNTLRDGMQDQSIQITKGTWVTNPLNWKSSTEDGELVPASENLGAVFFPENSEPIEYPEYTSAQIKDSGLVCDVADPSLLSESSMPDGIYHRDDYSLFYNNLKENAKGRIQAFFDKTK